MLQLNTKCKYNCKFGAIKGGRELNLCGSHLERRLVHVCQKMAILDVLLPSLLVVDASGVAQLLRSSSEVNNVRKFQHIWTILKSRSKQKDLDRLCLNKIEDHLC